MRIATAAVFCLVAAGTVLAGTGGSDMNSIWSTIYDWIGGAPGKAAAILGFLAGLWAMARGQMGVGLILIFSCMTGGALRFIVESRFTGLF